jgi:hypothetical protein
MDTHFPSEVEVDELLGMLVGRRVGLAPGRSLSLYSGAAVGLYTRDDGSICAAAICDLPLAVYLGSALAMVPPRVAQDQLKKRSLGEMGPDALHEVMNIAASLFNGGSTAHVRLSGMSIKPAPLSSEAMERLGSPRRRMDLRVDVGGYGEGELSLLAA